MCEPVKRKERDHEELRGSCRKILPSILELFIFLKKIAKTLFCKLDKSEKKIHK
jgi:hypothetical protein